MIQGSEEWFEARRGNVTGSMVWAILPGKKGNYLASRKDYMMQLVCEILTGKTEESYVSSDMQRGTDLEPEARAVYEAITGDIVKEVGFIMHPTIPEFGASPDGLPTDKVLEIKCPKTLTHVHTLTTGEYDYKYKIQMHAEMMCTGTFKCDFFSFDNRLPYELSYKIIELEYDFTLALDIENEIKIFNEEKNMLVEKLRGMM